MTERQPQNTEKKYPTFSRREILKGIPGVVAIVGITVGTFYLNGGRSKSGTENKIDTSGITPIPVVEPEKVPVPSMSDEINIFVGSPVPEGK